MEREWKLGEDLSREDSLLDGMSFDELILTVHCNCEKITPGAVRKELKDIIESRMIDTYFLVENNMSEIIALAKEGREENP